MVLSRFNPHLTSRLGAVRSDANFNPHPISWLDASGLWKSFTAPVMGDDSCVFNPRPTSRLGATFDLRIVGLVSILAQPYWLGAEAGNKQWIRLVRVSILTQSFGWVQLVWTKSVVVSILIQSLGWVQACRRFNPHLTSRPGADGAIHNPGAFQSSSNFSAGRRFVDVSILAQPLGRVQVAVTIIS